MNKLGAAPLGLASIGALAAAVYYITFWASRGVFAAAEMFGVAIGLVALGIAVVLAFAARAVWHGRRWGWITAAVVGVGLGLIAYVLWSMPGPPPVPVVVTAAIAGLAAGLIAVSGIRALT